MKRLPIAPRILALLAVTVLSIAAVTGLAFVESDAPARLYQLDAVIQVATSLATGGDS